MSSYASQSLPCARAALSRTLAPRQHLLRTPLTATNTSRCLLQQQQQPSQRGTYATAANAAAAARAAAQRKAPRSFARPPTPPPTKTPEEQLARGYVVRRTSSVQLPVYRKLKSGDTRAVVLIKRVEGDHKKLVEDLKADMDLAAGKIRINPTTKHIELSVSVAGSLSFFCESTSS